MSDQKVPYTGERRDLSKLLGVDWAEAIQSVHRREVAVQLGDYVPIPIKAAKTAFKGITYDSIDTVAKAEVVHITGDKIVFNFEDVLFVGQVNGRNTNEGGFKASVLNEYLNSIIAESFAPVAGIMADSDVSGGKLSLPTMTELFGGQFDFYGKEVNWGIEENLAHFSTEKKRVKEWKGETWWWWSSSPRASDTTHFCDVSAAGTADNGGASTAYGCSPCFCIRLADA